MDDFRKYLNRRSRSIKYVEKSIRPRDIMPIQKEFDPAKVEKFKKWLIDNPQEPRKPVVISKDLYVIDGHHRWLAAMDHPNTPVEVLQINLPFAEVLKLAKQYAATKA